MGPISNAHKKFLNSGHLPALKWLRQKNFGFGFVLGTVLWNKPHNKGAEMWWEKDKLKIFNSKGSKSLYVYELSSKILNEHLHRQLYTFKVHSQLTKNSPQKWLFSKHTINHY